ncbi:MAG: aa3-type cytochrome c oxidase subunit IV [Pseudorhodoplanes sp.]|nr:MAG: aa3-type cytochrome c oxidase subunit IV [Pseudorhodoplanes sp.]
MADHGEIQYSTADGNDYLAHEQTYRLFLQLAKWGIAVIVAILALMAFFLV